MSVNVCASRSEYQLGGGPSWWLGFEGFEGFDNVCVMRRLIVIAIVSLCITGQCNWYFRQSSLEAPRLIPPILSNSVSPVQKLHEEPPNCPAKAIHRDTALSLFKPSTWSLIQWTKFRLFSAVTLTQPVKKKIRPFKPFKAKLYDLNNWFGNVPVVFAQLPGGSRWPVVCRGGCQVISPWWHLGAFPGKMSCETYGLVIWDFNQISTKRGYTDDDSDWRHLHFFSRICLFQDNSQTTYYLPSSNPRNSTSIIPT